MASKDTPTIGVVVPTLAAQFWNNYIDFMKKGLYSPPCLRTPMARKSSAWSTARRERLSPLIDARVSKTR
jgi:hypothetical protein